MSDEVGIELRITLQYTGKIFFKFDFSSSLLLEYCRARSSQRTIF